MDMWKYFAVTHTDHALMNPLSVGKMREIVDLLRLEENGHVLDVACGKASSLRLPRLRGKRHGCRDRLTSERRRRM